MPPGAPSPIIPQQAEAVILCMFVGWRARYSTAVERGEAHVVGFGDVDAERPMQRDHGAQDVHRVEVELVAQGTSEGGVVARGCYRDTGIHLADDLIIEPVDEHGAAMPCGPESASQVSYCAPLLPLVHAGIVFLDGVQQEGKASKTRARAA